MNTQKSNITKVLSSSSQVILFINRFSGSACLESFVCVLLHFMHEIMLKMILLVALWGWGCDENEYKLCHLNS